MTVVPTEQQLEYQLCGRVAGTLTVARGRGVSPYFINAAVHINLLYIIISYLIGKLRSACIHGILYFSPDRRAMMTLLYFIFPPHNIELDGFNRVWDADCLHGDGETCHKNC